VPEYDVGDVAETNVITPVDFDAVDPLATKQAREKAATNFAPVLRLWPQACPNAEAEFRAAFAREHTWFLEALQQHYRRTKLNQVTVEHPSFSLFLGWVQKENPNFPCATNLARAWALGDSGQMFENELASKLSQTMQQYIHRDAWPAEYKEGPVRVFSVKGTEVIPDLDEVEKRSVEVAKEKLYTLSEARAELTKTFSAAEQPLAKYLSGYLKENCAFDVSLTERLQKARLANLWVTQHYKAGELILQSGTVVDDRIKSALEALSGKRVDEQRKLAAAAARQEKIDAIKAWLLSAYGIVCAVVSQTDAFQYAMSLALVGLLLGWYLLRRQSKRSKTPPASATPATVTAYTVVMHPERQETIFLPVKAAESEVAPVKVPPPESSLLRDASWEERAREAETHAEELLAMVRSGLAPHLAKELMNRLVQELVAQRRALLQTQQAAGQEIASIEARFTSLCGQLQEQIKAYEHRTQHLEEKLANKDEENSELLKAMIATQKKLQSKQGDANSAE
jgi:hypothetical protein